MKFDVVVGNPPYNNDIYIPFVELGHNLSSICSVWITPAKWQAKGGKDNEAFRKNIVPHMSKIVYYPDCCNIFEIGEDDGITYYILQKNKQDDVCNVTVKDKCKSHTFFNTEEQRINSKIIHETLYGEDIRKIIIKCNNEVTVLKRRYDLNYKLYVSLLIMIGGRPNIYNNEGTLQLLPIPKIQEGRDNLSNNFKVINSFSTYKEAESFKSFVQTRVIRFLMFVAIVGNSVTVDEIWRFVPDPGAFDHIFTDEELYKKYNLTKEEINIIESVIKERK